MQPLRRLDGGMWGKINVSPPRANYVCATVPLTHRLSYMRAQNGRRGYCAKYIQLIQSVGMYRQKVVPSCKLYWNKVHWHEFQFGSAVCIWRKILVFHFAGLSI